MITTQAQRDQNAKSRKQLTLKLKEAGSTGADLSPGDPLCAAAEQELTRAAGIEAKAQALIDDVRRRYPGEELYCPLMRSLDEALRA